ncbi:sensor histidine kinase [Amycolatopsis minnesotensis]
MRQKLARWRRPGAGFAVAVDVVLIAFVAVLTLALADLVPSWGWPGVLESTAPVLTGVLACAAVLIGLRRVWPVAALLGAAVLFGLFPATGAACAAVAYGAGGRLRTTGRRWAVFGPAALIPVAVVLLTQPAFRWKYVVVVIAISTIICMAVPGLVGTVQTQQARLFVALGERAEFLAQARHFARSEARLEERSRIAGEMHDQLGHRLSLISVYCGALEVAAKGQEPKLYEAAHQVRSTARTALDELRHSLGALRPDAEPADSEEATGTEADVARLVESSRAGGIDVTLDWRGPDLAAAPPPLRRAVHRVVREALTNVHKHAAAAPVTVTVDHGDRVLVEVRNGPEPSGAAPDRLPGTGRGLVALQERARLLGGKLTAGAEDGGDFVVSMSLPTTALPVHEPSSVDTPVAADEPVAVGRPVAGLVSGLMLGTGLAAVDALLLMTLAFVPPLAPVDSEDPLASVQLGMTPNEVEEWFGPNEPVAEIAAGGHEPPRPDGTECAYVSADDSPDAAVAAVFRFCFGEDGLAEKTVFEIGLPGRPE